MKKVLLASLLLALSLTSLQANKVLTVGVENIEYFPHYSHENGEYNGFAREVLDAFAKEKGYTFVYEIMPVRRLFSMFLKNRLDLKYPDNPYWSADDKKGKNVVYSDDVVDYIDGAMVKPENKGKGIDSVKKLGRVMGFTAWDYMDYINSGKIDTVDNKNFTALLKQGIAGRIDVAYSNVAVARYQLEDTIKQPGALVFDETLPHTKAAYKLSTIKHPEVIEEFNAFLKEKVGMIEAMKKKYKVNVTQ